MSQQSVTMLTYAIALTAENAPKIDQINRLLLGSGYTATAETSSGTTTAPKTETASSGSAITMKELKDAARAGKKEHGDEFCQTVIASVGGEVKGSIGRSLSALDESMYEAFIAGIAAGPQDADTSDDMDEFGDDDEFGDEEEAPDPAAVQTALKAMAKTDRDSAKKIMTSNGAASLSAVPNCSADQLRAMLKALV